MIATTRARRGPRRIPDGLTPVLRSTLTRPNLGDAVLLRPRLLGALSEHAERPLSLVVADAGFGKTTLLASFAGTVRRPVVWYSLMPWDADAVVFGRHLLAGFRQHAPRFGRSFEHAIGEAPAGSVSGESLAGSLLHDLSELKGPPALLVLDDLHEIADQPTVMGILDALLRQLPASLRLIIGARGIPPLALDRLRARAQLFELDAGHLRFTRDELARLLAGARGAGSAETDVDALERATAGWPTAVHLVLEALHRAPDCTMDSVLSEFAGTNLALHDFLSSEVLGHLEPDERRVLERVAALQRFDAGLASELAGVPDAAAVLRRLARRGLVQSYGAASGTSYELIDPVRQQVRRRLEEESAPGASARLEAETARLLASRGESERALRHYLLAGCGDEAGRLAVALAGRMLREGRAAALLQYLLDLPDAIIRADPELLLALADARQQCGHWDEAERHYVEARARCDASGRRDLVCRALLGLSKVLNMRGRHEEVLGIAELGLGMAEDLDVDTRIRLLQRKAGAHFYLGQSRAAVRILDQVRRLLPQASDHDLELPTMHNQAMAMAAQGKFREASEELKAALAQVRGTSSPRAPLYLSNLAFLLAELGELADARAAAEEGLAAARRFGKRAQEITCREALAQVLAQSGDLDGALAALREAEALNRDQRMEVIAGDLLALRGRIFCARGQYRRAVQFLEQAIERSGADGERPRAVEFKGLVAWCELRAGRPRVARTLLTEVAAKADARENDYERMRAHYWLAEARLALGEHQDVRGDLAPALKRVREHGFGYFLGVQAREEPAPLLYALDHGIETDVVAAALVEAGSAIEGALLERLEKAAPRAREAIATVLAEVGGARALERMKALAAHKPALQGALRPALRAIASRAGRGGTSATRGGPAVRLFVFGPPRLEVDGRAVPASAWRAQRAFHVLIYLALVPRGANRDRLLETFWPGRQLAAGRRNFHPTLSYIRSVLPATTEAPLMRDGELYRLNPRYPLECDAWELDRHLEAARHASDVRGRRDSLERAAELAALPFLEGIYTDWADELQGRMRDRVEQILLQCGELCAKQGAHEKALAYFRRASALDGFRETTRVAAIDCLMRLGNRRAAVVEYQRFTELLRAELGVTPLAETESRVRTLIGPDALGDAGDGPDAATMQWPAGHDVAASSQARLKGLSGD